MAVTMNEGAWCFVSGTLFLYLYYCWRWGGVYYICIFSCSQRWEMYDFVYIIRAPVYRCICHLYLFFYHLSIYLEELYHGYNCSSKWM